MDFYYQSGEFYGVEQSSQWSELFGAFGGAIVGGIVSGIFAIILFRRTIRHERRREEEREAREKQKEIERENSRLNSTLRLFMTRIESLSVYITDNIATYKEFSDNLIANPLGDNVVSKKPNHDLKRINSINTEDILRAIKLHITNETKAEEVFDKLYKGLDFIEASEEMSVRILETLSDEIYKLKLQFRDDLNTLLNTTGRIMNDIRSEDKNFTNNEYYKFLGGMIELYYDKLTLESPFDYHFANFINPLKFGLIERFRDEKNVIELLEQSKNITLLRTSIMFKATNEMATRFIQLSQNLETLMDKFNGYYGDLKTAVGKK